MIFQILILMEPTQLPFCLICIVSKMITQPHYNAYTSSNIPGYCIHVNVRESANIYIIWKGYQYLMLLIDTTTVIWVGFMKKKSEVLTIFFDFVIILESYCSIRIYLRYTNFDEFNSNAIAEYFNYTSIIWELFIQNA